MENSLLIAGFGGQGVVLVGQLLGYAASSAGKNATYYPSYGAEQRGGTANCTVVISDEEIGSPVVSRPDVVIVMNEPSLVRFEERVKPGGTLIFNSSLIKRVPARTDIKVVAVPANDMAEKLGSDKIANMVVLGAYIGVSQALSLESVMATMKAKLDKKPEMVVLNEAAILAGVQCSSV